MRRRWRTGLGAAVAAATVGTAVSAFQIDPDIVTSVSAQSTGIWIPVEVSGEIVHIDGGTGDVTARVTVAEPEASLELAERHNGVVVVDTTAGRVSLVDPALHEVVREVRITPADDRLVDIGDEVVVIGTAQELVIIDVEVTESATVDIDADLRSVAAEGVGAVASQASQILEVSGDGSVESVGTPDAVVVRAADTVYEISGVDVRARDGGAGACLSRPLTEASLVSGDISGWIVVVDPGLVQLAEPATGACRQMNVGEKDGENEPQLGPAVVARGHIFVPEPAAGVVHVIDPQRRKVEAHRVPFQGGDIKLRARGDVVAAFTSGSSFAALVDETGVVDFLDTSPEDREFQAVLGDGGATAIVGGEDADDEVVVGVEGGEGSLRPSRGAPVIDAAVLAEQINNPDQADEQVVDVLPVDELVANFAFSATTVVVGESVRFVDESSGSPESWVWDFGDGTGAEGPEVQKVWDQPGTYPVTLHVERGELWAEISLAITVVPAEVGLPPSSDFIFSASVVAAGGEVFFEDRSSGQITRWHWDFGDGTTSSAASVAKTWGDPGIYRVTLTVSNELGSDSATVLVEVILDLEAPVAEIEVDTMETEVGSALMFTGSSSTDPGSFAWDFGDGTTSTGPTVTHVFTETGTYTVTLRVENAAGQSVARIEIVVGEATLPPTAWIATLPDIVEVGDPVTLTSLSTNGPETEEWAFGDGNVATGSVVAHAWASPGTFLVSLTATNGAGSDTATALVQVVAELPPPVAVIGAFDASPWVGSTVAFSDASLDATGWLWDFGDGVTSTARNPLHTFTSSGQKTVALTVSNRNGTDSTSVTVEPRLQPVADFSPSNVAPRALEPVTFTDLSVNAVAWLWDFGDGDSSTVQNPDHPYAAEGTYEVVLTVTSATGDEDSSLPVTITVDPAAPLLSGITVGSDPATTLESTLFQAIDDPDSGPISVYEIDFGDGSSTEQSLTGAFAHAFAASGNYTVQVRAQSPLGDWSPFVTRLLAVNDPQPPLAQIAASVPATAPAGPVTLTGEVLPGSGPITSWTWEISGGSLPAPEVRSGQVASFTFNDPGVYSLQLTADGPVASATDSQSITITAPPPPDITSLVATPNPATTGTVVSFAPTVTGSVVTWEWDYENNGTFVVGTSAGATTFNTAGVHTVWLRVTGAFGGTDLISVDVTAYEPPDPTVPSQSPVGAIITGDTITFSSTESGGDPVTRWDWNVTNGVDSFDYLDSGPSIPHTFGSSGSWTVSVTATGPSGAQGSNLVIVSVSDLLVADFSFVVVGLGVTFADLSTGPAVTAWLWDFGDAIGTSSVANPSYAYAASGSYNVTLEVTAGGQTAQITKSVVVP